MTLRPVRAEDACALAAIHAQGFDRPWSAADLAAMATEPGRVALLEEEGDVVRGFILCRRIADEAEVLTVAVAPEARGAGVGRDLLQAAIARCAEAGAAVLWLEVAEDNAAALALYRTAGFVEAGRRRGYYPRPTGAADALVLRRPLK